MNWKFLKKFYYEDGIIDNLLMICPVVLVYLLNSYLVALTISLIVYNLGVLFATFWYSKG